MCSLCHLTIWQTALRPDVSGIAVDARVFHEAGCRLVHRYRVYKDPFPHPALRGGGGGVLPRLLSFVVRAMTIAKLTPLRISIPALGALPGRVPADCFPGGAPSQDLTSLCRVSFSSSVTVLGDALPPVHPSESGAQELLRYAVAEEDLIDTVRGTTDDTDTPPTVLLHVH